MVIESFFQALSNFGDGIFWVYLLTGVIIGLMVGIMPGIGGMLVMALLLTFVFMIKPAYALALMLAIHATRFVGGSVTAILVGIPGETPNAATILDGFQMTKNGQAGRALGISLTGSAAAALFTVLLALLMVPLILPMVLTIKSHDMVAIILSGLTFIGVLGEKNKIKGIVAGMLGMLVATVGFDPISGVQRFTFGTSYLYDGLALVPVSLGLFAITELANIAMEGESSMRQKVASTKLKDVLEGSKDVFRYWTIWLRASVIGFIIGVLPGIGSGAASFISYAQAKQTSKHPELFGTGIPEGVLAPETACSSEAAGALLTTLALGIPGSTAMTMLLAAFLMVNLVPGPDMLTSHLDLSLTLFLVIVVGNILASLICFFAAPHLAKLAALKPRLLVPMIFVLVFVGAYAFEEQILDVVLVLVFGVLGLILGKLHFSKPAFMLGFVLGGIFEKFMFLGYQASGYFFFVRPVSLIVLSLTAIMVAYEPVRDAMKRRRAREAGLAAK